MNECVKDVLFVMKWLVGGMIALGGEDQTWTLQFQVVGAFQGHVACVARVCNCFKMLNVNVAGDSTLALALRAKGVISLLHCVVFSSSWHILRCVEPLLKLCSYLI